jgi:hypothetical protein
VEYPLEPSSALVPAARGRFRRERIDPPNPDDEQDLA